MVVVIDEEMAVHAESPGWSLSTSMLPVHLAYNMSMTVDPSAHFNPDEWPHRSMLVWKRGREYEVFECGEYWQPNRALDLDTPGFPELILYVIGVMVVSEKKKKRCLLRDRVREWKVPC